jgi:diguanylate cyclase (GGDEF)-like protein/PAS domain S-box-containing protein
MKPTPSTQAAWPPLSSHAVLVLALGVVFLALWSSPPVHVLQGLVFRLPIHTLLETFAVAVAALIFGLGWHAYTEDKPGNVLLLACAFLAVALIDVAHFLSYPGMPDFVTASSAQKSIAFWLCARLVAALALLAVALLPWRPYHFRGAKYWLLGASLTVAGLVYWIVLYHQESLPLAFIAGKGLTPFKIRSEYFLIAIHGATALLFALRLRTRQPFDAGTLLAAVCVMILSELCFTLYSDVTDAFSLLGHVYKVIAYGLLYKAVFSDSVREPYAQLAEAQYSVWEEKERAEVTLHSIGDAVITTDLEGRVENINPVAQQLTGWSHDEARGQPLEHVFRIIGEEDGLPLDNPARRAINEGVVVGLANHTVLLSRDGKVFSIEDSAAPIRARDGSIIGCVLVFHDVTEKRELQRQLEWQAGHDALTGLPNRVILEDRLHQAIARARRDSTLLAVCFVDLDAFKQINDHHGPAVGDQLLVEVARRFGSLLRAGDTVARLGGDEFVVLLTDLETQVELEAALGRVLKLTSSPHRVNGTELQVSASIGVTLYPLDDAPPDELVRHADHAMYLAKQAGRNRYHLFDADQDKQAQLRQLEVQRLREALRDNEFTLYYQPKVNMRTGEVVGLEALIRWIHPERGLVPPIEFLPLAEQSGLILEMGEWVVRDAFRQMAIWAKAGLMLPVSINVAARQLQQPDFVERLKTCVSRHPTVAPHWLELEILESTALDDIAHARTIIEECRELGVRFALDDFGTGYSSLAYLKQLPVDTIKIDQTFVRDILDDPDDIALIEGVISLANVFQRNVIAEGVESVEHGVLLMRLGCELAQGYGIARPMPGTDVFDWVHQFTPDPQWQLWSGHTWDMSDFPLLVAQYDHLKWVKQIASVLEGIPLHLPRQELFDPHECRFGQWHDGPGRHKYGHLQGFAGLQTVHSEVHRVGAEIMRLHENGKMEEAKRLLPVLLQLKDEVLQRLAALQQEVANTVCLPRKAAGNA